MAQHVLVVDDDRDVRDVIINMLIDHDFVTTAVSDGVAMRGILARRTPIDAIVLDSFMPGEPSTTLALHAKSLEIPVVMISGSPVKVKFAEDNGLQLLLKPFRVEELIQAVERAIASGHFGQRGA
jgi:DNA-binding NtrC family response regulator